MCILESWKRNLSGYRNVGNLSLVCGIFLQGWRDDNHPWRLEEREKLIIAKAKGSPPRRFQQYRKECLMSDEKPGKNEPNPFIHTTTPHLEIARAQVGGREAFLAMVISIFICVIPSKSRIKVPKCRCKSFKSCITQQNAPYGTCLSGLLFQTTTTLTHHRRALIDPRVSAFK